MYHLIPEAKLIAILRNPTDRAISHYFHEKHMGRESLSISRAFEEEDKRLKPLIQNKDFKSGTFINCSYKSRGLYRDQLERYLEYFPREHVLILCSEEFFREPRAAIGRVLEFLAVERGFRVEDVTPQYVATNKAKVDPEIYQDLDDYFAPHNQALYQLVGRTFGW